MNPRHTHLMDGTWDGQSDARIAELHPECIACKAGIPNNDLRDVLSDFGAFLRKQQQS